MKKFTCVEKTTYQGAIKKKGESITISDEEAKSLVKNKCWKPVAAEKPAAPKK